MTHIVFWTDVVISLACIFTALFRPQYALILAFAIFVNVWSIIQSERHGFVKAKEMRRAFEPPRHFNGFHIFIVVTLIIAEVLLGTLLLF